jgi:hypothetical protein
MDNFKEKYLETIKNDCSADIQRFIKSYDYDNIEEMIPFGEYISPIAAELIAASVAKAQTFIMNDYEKNTSKYKFIPAITMLVPAENYRGKTTPFFNTGYFGVKMHNINNMPFYFMIDPGRVGLEDMRTATADIAGKKIDLTFKQSRSFGDAGIHAQDFNKAVDILTNQLIKAFFN